MAFNQDIPQSSDDPSQSQSQLLANFQALNTFLSVNHEDINDSDEGKHKFMQMPSQSSAPSTAAGETAQYVKTSAYTGNPEWHYRRQSSGSEIDLTGSRKASEGWFYAPSGVLIKWGTATGSGEVTATYRVNADTPVFNQVFYATCQCIDNVGVPNSITTLKSFSTTQLSAYCSLRTATTAISLTFHYLVIGK